MAYFQGFNRDWRESRPRLHFHISRFLSGQHQVKRSVCGRKVSRQQPKFWQTICSNKVNPELRPITNAETSDSWRVNFCGPHKPSSTDSKSTSERATHEFRNPFEIARFLPACSSKNSTLARDARSGFRVRTGSGRGATEPAVGHSQGAREQQ